MGRVLNLKLLAARMSRYGGFVFFFRFCAEVKNRAVSFGRGQTQTSVMLQTLVPKARDNRPQQGSITGYF